MNSRIGYLTVAISFTACMAATDLTAQITLDPGDTAAQGVVVSNLPGADAMDTFLCFDSATGELGKCLTPPEGPPGPQGEPGPRVNRARWDRPDPRDHRVIQGSRVNPARWDHPDPRGHQVRQELRAPLALRDRRDRRGRKVTRALRVPPLGFTR